MDGYFTKAVNNTLYACDQDGAEFIRRLRTGETVHVKAVRKRNIQFHRKFFAMLDYVFDVWEPQDVEVPQYLSVRGITPEKNKERFRKDLIILAGYFDSTIRVNGEIRIEAKSMSFASMDEDTFAELYNKVVDVAIRHIQALNMSADELKVTIDGLLEYT
jgi:hypothetical protein